MTITLNGNKKELEGIATISALLKELELAADSVVVELNTKIIPPDSYEATSLAQGDTVELIRFVGGG